MSEKPWFELPVEERDKCENCGIDITATLVTRSGIKFCSERCAKAKTGLEFDPDLDKYVKVVSRVLVRY